MQKIQYQNGSVLILRFDQEIQELQTGEGTRQGQMIERFIHGGCIFVDGISQVIVVREPLSGRDEIKTATQPPLRDQLNNRFRVLVSRFHQQQVTTAIRL